MEVCSIQGDRSQLAVRAVMRGVSQAVEEIPIAKHISNKGLRYGEVVWVYCPPLEL